MASKVPRKRWLIVGIAVVVVGAVVGIALSRDSSSPPDEALPIVTWNQTILSELRGTPVVLNFWTIWCYWCRRQMPYLENVARQGGREIKVIAINIADDAASIRSFFKGYRPAMTIAVDTNRRAFVEYSRAHNNTGSIPFTLFLDSQGIVKYVRIGAFASEAALKDALKDALGISIPETP